MTIKALALSAAAAAFTATSSLAAGVTLNVVGGQLFGASNVDVNGTLYDVEFLDGSCAALFDGCDEASDFAFTTLALALTAAESLRDTVFLDGPLGDFDSDPTLTYGIEPVFPDIAGFPNFGTTIIPYDLHPTVSRFMGSGFFNSVYPTADLVGPTGGPQSSDYSSRAELTFARFTPSQIAAVPLPAGGFLLLAALAGFGALAACRKRSAVR